MFYHSSLGDDDDKTLFVIQQENGHSPIMNAEPNRREFLKRTATGVAVATVSGCTENNEETSREQQTSPDSSQDKSTTQIASEMFTDTVHIGDIKLKNPANVLRLSDLQGFSHGTRWPTWNHVMAPGHLLARKHYLDTEVDDLSQYDPRECVSFVFGGGEDDEDRATTRIGSLPFWPQEMPWPKAQDGSAKQFIGQFDFRNVVWPERLPGDVLTVHFDYDWDGDGRFDGPADGAAATLTWHDSQKTENLIARVDLPPPNEWYAEPGPFYGRPVLATDYKSESSEHWRALTIHGMKIGGHSQFYGDNWVATYSSVRDPVFLCSIGYIKPYKENEEQDAWLPSKKGFDPSKAGDVMFLDVGMLVIAYSKGNPDNLHWMSYLP